MAFEQVIDLDCANSTALGGFNKKTRKDNPTSAEGYFVGTRMVPSPKAKSGECALHVLQTKEGNLGIWGKTDLDRKLKAVTPGVMVRITFTGMQETKNNPMYKFRVEIDKTNTIDVGALANETPTANNDEVDGDEAEDFESAPADEVELPRASAPARTAQAPSPERQAQVQALLNRSRRA